MRVRTSLLCAFVIVNSVACGDKGSGDGDDEAGGSSSTAGTSAHAGTTSNAGTSASSAGTSASGGTGSGATGSRTPWRPA
mgnify:CR=1 FL=1